MHHPTDRVTHTTVFVTPVVEHWLEREIAQFTTSQQGHDGYGCLLILGLDMIAEHLTLLPCVCDISL